MKLCHPKLRNIWVFCRECPHFRAVYNNGVGVYRNTCGLSTHGKDPDKPRHCIDFPFRFSEKWDILGVANGWIGKTRDEVIKYEQKRFREEVKTI